MSYQLKSRFITLTNKSRLHHMSVPVIGLTGGIATGKSTISNLLEKSGVPIISADLLIKTIYQKDETINFIKLEFPTTITNDTIDFKKLREIAFISSINREKLELFLYKHLPVAFINQYKVLGKPSYVIYDVPLLFEKGLHKRVDTTLLIYADRATQIERVMKRDNISKELAEKILGEQIDIEIKRSLATYTFENTANPDDVAASIKRLLFTL